MSEDDVLFGYRLRLFALAGEIGVRAACRAMGVHHSIYYRWAEKVERWGLEALRPRERRRPRMPNQLGPHLEQRIVAFALGQPGVRSQEDQRGARSREVGRPEDLAQRRLAGAEAPRPQHAPQEARVGRRLRRRVRAQTG
jgi:Helix-turn-helix domain